MKNVKFLCERALRLAAGWLPALALFSASCAHPQAGRPGFWGQLESGPYAAGFRLIETADMARSFPANDWMGTQPRPMRIYVWYPAKRSTAAPMRLDDYAGMARSDFRPSSLPVPLAKGFDEAGLHAALASSTGAVRDAVPQPGRFPPIVLGQGLFYESPLSHFVLCEFFASHGYVVATSPLLGTRYRLVNINIEDIETEVRDMEIVMEWARSQLFANAGKTGVIGYDLGGMAGLLLCMRHPEVGAFLSLDSGILDRHPSGLPNSHPGYREDRFRIPWMHLTQARFIRTKDERSLAPSLFERKNFGANYLVHVPTTNHGDFSSYAAMGGSKAVPGYWDLPKTDPRPLYEQICRIALAFFDSAVKNEGEPLEKLLSSGPASAPTPASRPGSGSGSVGGSGADQPALTVEWKKGGPVPPAEAELVRLTIEKGLPAAMPAIDRARAEFPGLKLIDESVLNWLGLHFLLWWDRSEEAVGVFELITVLYPESWQAYDTLGEVYAERGRTADAVRSYQKSLAINPKNDNARTALEKLASPHKEESP